MTFNESLIRDEFKKYNKLYYSKFSEYPKSWFGYLKWLSSKYGFVGGFNSHECKIAKELFKEG